MSNNKQTSVEQLFHKLWDEPKDKFTWYTMLKEHMAMEKEQILQSLNDGKAMVIGTIENKSLEQYYNETYGDPEQSIIDYNAMEEESEMDNYNEMNNE